MHLGPEEMKAWNEGEARRAQKRICVAKLADASLQETLRSTGDAYLLHQDNRAKEDTPWGGKLRKGCDTLNVRPEDVVGKNELGLLWMQCREELS